MSAYHVAPTDHIGELVSLYRQHGTAAYEMYAIRWPESGALAEYHAHYVHMYATVEGARQHAAVNGGKIYEVDTDAMIDDYYKVEIDNLEFPHPMVRDSIPAEYIKEIA